MHFIKVEGGSKLNDGKFKMEAASERLVIRQVTHQQTHARVPKSNTATHTFLQTQRKWATLT